MAIEQVKKLLEAIKSDPKTKELMKGVSEPRSEEEMIRLCAEIAPKLGFDITEAELREAVAALAKERQDKTAADVEKLSDEEVAQASGGKKDHPQCLDSFRNGENCWYTDGCDHNYQDYDNYICRNNSNGNTCGFFGQSCDAVFWCDKATLGPDDVDKCMVSWAS